MDLKAKLAGILSDSSIDEIDMPAAEAATLGVVVDAPRVLVPRNTVEKYINEQSGDVE